jgi:hypothetical protein
MLRWNECGAGGRVLEGLSHFPGALQFLGFGLQIAARHVDADGIAEDVLHCLRGLDVGAARFEANDQLDLEVHILSGRRIGEFPVNDDVVWVLLKEERRVLDVAAHFPRMFDVVAAHAVNAVDRKELVRAPDRERRLRSGIEGVSHKRGLCW